METGSRVHNKHDLERTELIPEYLEITDGSFKVHPCRKLLTIFIVKYRFIKSGLKPVKLLHISVAKVRAFDELTLHCCERGVCHMIHYYYKLFLRL